MSGLHSAGVVSRRPLVLLSGCIALLSTHVSEIVVSVAKLSHLGDYCGGDEFHLGSLSIWSPIFIFLVHLTPVVIEVGVLSRSDSVAH